MNHPNEQDSLELYEIIEEPGQGGVQQVILQTNGGDIDCRLHPVPGGARAVVWVGGAGGGFDGPAHGMYPRLASRLIEDKIASLRLDYRRPNELIDCILDTLIGAAYLDHVGYHRIALVGHSFGGAVVIGAGASSDPVVGIAALSSQTYGTGDTPDLSPKSLLLIHGEADQVLPVSCSRNIYRRARHPRKLLLYPGCGHGLDECREQVDHDLRAWLLDILKGE